MGLTYNIEKDAFFKKGKERGEEKGIKKRMKQRETDMVINLLKSAKLSTQEIAEIAGLTIGEVETIAAKI